MLICDDNGFTEATILFSFVKYMINYITTVVIVVFVTFVVDLKVSSSDYISVKCLKLNISKIM